MAEATGKRWYERKTVKDYMLVALESDNADIRREALTKVAKSRAITDDWAIRGLDAIARTDKASQVRCVALRTLSRADDARAVSVSLQVLNHEKHADSVRAPDDDVRWECLLILERNCTHGTVAEKEREAVRDTFIQHVTHSKHRDARVTSARGLRHFLDRPALDALIEALKDRDFGVVYQAERSLAMLTGTTHNHDPDAWKQWLSETADPFADAGMIPETLDPPKKTWWQKTRERLR